MKVCQMAVVSIGMAVLGIPCMFVALVLVAAQELKSPFVAAETLNLRWTAAPLAIGPAIAAVICGFVALRRIEEEGFQLAGERRARFGVGIGILLFLLGIFIVCVA